MHGLDNYCIIKMPKTKYLESQACALFLTFNQIIFWEYVDSLCVIALNEGIRI